MNALLLWMKRTSKSMLFLFAVEQGLVNFLHSTAYHITPYRSNTNEYDKRKFKGNRVQLKFCFVHCVLNNGLVLMSNNANKNKTNPSTHWYCCSFSQNNTKQNNNKTCVILRKSKQLTLFPFTTRGIFAWSRMHDSFFYALYFDCIKYSVLENHFITKQRNLCVHEVDVSLSAASCNVWGIKLEYCGWWTLGLWMNNDWRSIKTDAWMNEWIITV